MTYRARLQGLLEDIRGSYWFLPALLTLAGLVAAVGLVILDARIGEQWLGRWNWLYGTRPEGARQILATISGSTITVAGVVFSITLAAVTYASGQHGPRLLSNFMRDRGNQTTLGVFVATFLYCLVVLRSVRSAEETSADTGGAVREAFVPHAAMFGALALAIASIGVLIYFVHHVTDGIHINSVISRIGRQLIDDIRQQREADGDGGNSASVDIPVGPGAQVRADRTGYIKAIDDDALLALACDRDLVLRLLRRPGDFVHEGRPLLEAVPPRQVDDALASACIAAFVIGDRRTALQDLRFAIDELVEIAARALSPGINDPFTAVACIDWLGAAVSELALAEPPVAMLADQRGLGRVHLRRLRFEDYVASAFGQLRPYAAADPIAGPHTTATLDEIAAGLHDETRLRCLAKERDCWVAAGASDPP